MGRSEREVSATLGAAIARELGAHDSTEAVNDDAVNSTARELVREALLAGRSGAFEVTGIQAFSAGSTAMLVARLETALQFVVKVDTSPAIVDEAHLLTMAASDPALPPAIRDAFPRVYAVDDTPPVYGYLMEDLSGYSTFRDTLRNGPSEQSERIIAALWTDLLGPAYAATRSTRVMPNAREDYFERARARLLDAAGAGLLPGPDHPLRVERGSSTTECSDGWGAAIDRAIERLAVTAPRFGTFVHGDPNPENVLWQTKPDGTFSFRLIDPKDWWVGDYLFDVAKVVHYLRVTEPVEALGIEASLESGTDFTRIGYDPGGIGRHAAAEGALVAHVGRFATDPERPDDPNWQDRLELAVAANLLGIVGPRLRAAERDRSPGDRHLALIALGEGLRTLGR